jgi:hypothetical protein
MNVLVILGLVLALCLSVALAMAYVRSRKKQQFPPVVELAHTTTLPRLGHKIASMTARETTPPPTPTAPPALPPVPFVMVAEPVSPSHPDAVLAAENPTAAFVPPPVTGYVAPVPATSTDDGKSIYEVGKSPYAAPIVQGAVISLPDDDEGDLPIKFRSDHPSAKPIVEAGDHANDVRIAGADGRIHLGHNAPVVFGPPTD